MPTDLPGREEIYVVYPENATRMAHILLRDRYITQSMGGIFSELREGLSPNVHRILDFGCGPGGWVIDVAYAYPKIEVIGIDFRYDMVEYARAQVREHRLENANFKTMDVLKSLDFPDGYFDLVNIRFMVGFLHSSIWPTVLQECFRILRPRGIIRLTDSDNDGLTNSAACEKLLGIATQALHREGYGFSPDGRSYGITPMLEKLLHDVGCQNVQRKPNLLDFSFGTELRSIQCQHYMVAFKLAQPMFTKTEVATQEEIDQALKQMPIEMLTRDFRGLWYILTAWGEKPV